MTENKYNNSKIYKIVCNITNEVYYGSTVQGLSKRLKGHVNDSKQFVLATLQVNQLSKEATIK